MESSATIGCLLKQWRMDKVSEPKIKLVALISNYYPFYTRDKKFKYFVYLAHPRWQATTLFYY